MGVFELLAGFRADRQIKKLIRQAPAHGLADFPENTFARVVGKVEPHRARVLEAPLSGRLCAYYAIIVRARKLRSAREPYSTIAEETEAVPFELVADGNRAVIDPKDAWISSGFDHKVNDIRDPRAAALIGRLDITILDVLIQEAVLAVNEQIAVFGAATRELDPGATGEAGYRDGAPLRLRFTGSVRFPLVIRDDVKSL